MEHGLEIALSEKWIALHQVLISIFYQIFFCSFTTNFSLLFLCCKTNINSFTQAYHFVPYHSSQIRVSQSLNNSLLLFTSLNC
jgi:hypothetical protein